jgi:formyltetrahydrofolate-dependent phosphoribosylglycinamide formyltransferase
MFSSLKAKWKVKTTQFILIFCTFAVTGTLTAWISRQLPGWIGFTDTTPFAQKLLLRIFVLIFGYQFIILAVSVLFGQFPFFWNYEKKILNKLFKTKFQLNSSKSFNIAIFASGTGSNAQQIINHFRNSTQIKVSLIVSNKSDAGVLLIAQKENIPFIVIDKHSFFETTSYINLLASKKIDFIVLAGSLLKVPISLLNAFPKKIINIHPALLPKFGGKGMYGSKVHEAVKNAGETETGITIHLVDEQYDHGKTLFQAFVSIDVDDSPETIAKKVLALEHQHFPLVIESYILKTNL